MRAAAVDADVATALATEFAVSQKADCVAIAVQPAADSAEGAAAQSADPAADTAAPTGAALAWSAVAPTGSESGPSSWLATDEVVLAASPQTLAALGWEGALTTDQLRSAIIGDPATAVPGTLPDVAVAVGDPATSSVSARAVAGLAMLAYGGPLTAPINYANPQASDLAVIKLEQGIVGARDQAPEGAQVVEVMTATQAKAAGMAAVSLGQPGAPVGLVLTGDDPNVASWRTWLAGPEGQAALVDHGLAAPDPAVLPAAMSQEQEQATRAMWAGMTTRISTFAVLDISWSMTEPMPGGPTPKIELLREYALGAWQLASPRAVSGVMTFNSDPNSHVPQVRTVVPLAENSTPSPEGTHALAGIAAVRSIDPVGGTPLYEAIQEGYREAVTNYKEGYANRVVVMTDGINEDSTSTVTAQQVSDTIAELYDPERPVQLIIVALRPDDSFPLLEGLAAQTKGKALAAAQLADLPATVSAALFEL